MIINGKYFKIYTLDEDTLCYHPSLEDEDLGKSYIVLNGCLQFVTLPEPEPEHSEDWEDWEEYE